MESKCVLARVTQEQMSKMDSRWEGTEQKESCSQPLG